MSYYNLCGVGSQHSNISKGNKGNAKRGISPRLKIRPCDL